MTSIPAEATPSGTENQPNVDGSLPPDNGPSAAASNGPAAILPSQSPEEKAYSAEKGWHGSERSDTVAIEDDAAETPKEDIELEGAKADLETAQPIAPWAEEGLTYWQRFRKSMIRPEGLTMVNAKPSDYPDGYYGWVVVAASFFVFLFGLGLMYSFGVYQRVYFYGNVFPGTTLFQLSWIGSLGMAVQTLVGPFTGRLTDKIGARWMSVIGGSFVGLAYITASFATQWWHLLLTQGFLYGLGAGCLYFSAVSLPGHWFFRLRGLAIGIAVAGAGLGGLVIAPLTQALIDAYGWRNALRITGIIAAAIIYISAVFIRLRFELIKTPTSRMFDTRFFKDYKFVMLFCSFFIQQFGYVDQSCPRRGIVLLAGRLILLFTSPQYRFFVPFNYMPSFAQNAGLTTSQGSLALGLSNASSALGRILIGAFADRSGYVNAYTVCMCLTPIFTLAIWPFASSFGILTFYGVLFGFFSGGFISLFPSW